MQDIFMLTHKREWRTLQAQGKYPYQMQWVQHHGLDNDGQKLEFCKSLNGNCQTSVHWIIVYNNWQKKLSTVCTLEHEKHSGYFKCHRTYHERSVSVATTNDCCSQPSVAAGSVIFKNLLQAQVTVN
jgi:hypothetical protein